MEGHSRSVSIAGHAPCLALTVYVPTLDVCTYLSARLGCCSWTNVTDTYATGYCCTNRDHKCSPDAPTSCRTPWLEEMWKFNLQVCVLLLVVGATHFFISIGLMQLRWFSRSSLYLYHAYGGSVREKEEKEKMMALEAAQKAEDATRALANGSLSDDDPAREQSTKNAKAQTDDVEEDEKEGEEAEKQPLTGFVAVGSISVSRSA